MENQKMSLRKYLIIWVPILAILLALIIVVTAVMNYYSGSLDTYLGMGERVVTVPTGTENWDTKYYESKYSSDTGENGSQLGAAKVAKSISDEGDVLLKNNGVLPLATSSKVTPFGYRYTAPVYGGTGSGNVDVSAAYTATAKSALTAKFDVNAAMESVMNAATPDEIKSTEITPAKKKPDENSFDGAGSSIIEFNPTIYSGAAASCKGTTGIVFVGRIGGEGSDLQKTPYVDGTPHHLALSTYEKDTIKFAKKNCDNVVVVVNSSNVMELAPLKSGDYEADAIHCG